MTVHLRDYVILAGQIRQIERQLLKDDLVSEDTRCGAKESEIGGEGHFHVVELGGLRLREFWDHWGLMR